MKNKQKKNGNNRRHFWREEGKVDEVTLEGNGQGMTSGRRQGKKNNVGKKKEEIDEVMVEEENGQ